MGGACIKTRSWTKKSNASLHSINSISDPQLITGWAQGTTVLRNT